MLVGDADDEPPLALEHLPDGQVRIPDFRQRIDGAVGHGVFSLAADVDPFLTLRDDRCMKGKALAWASSLRQIAAAARDATYPAPASRVLLHGDLVLAQAVGQRRAADAQEPRGERKVAVGLRERQPQHARLGVREGGKRAWLKRVLLPEPVVGSQRAVLLNDEGRGADLLAGGQQVAEIERAAV